MEWKELEKLGYKNKSIDIIEYWYERTCVVCGKVASSEHRQALSGSQASAITDAIRRNQSDEFTKHLMQRGWSTAPPLCKKCRINFVCQSVEDMLPKGGASK